jgi:hypothetical protein
MPRHPVHELLAEAAYAGRELTEEELAELQLGASDRELVKKAARESAFAHAGGERDRAREHARERALEIVAGLPEEKQDPRYLHDPNEPREDDPRELAARVLR